MEDTTKGALVGGGIVAIVGAIASFITYKESHANGVAEGLAKGFALKNDKSKQLNEKVVELQNQIQKLEELKELCGKDAAITRELCNFLKEKQIISYDVYGRFVKALEHGKIDDLLSWYDTTINAEHEALNVLNGGAGEGIVTHARKVDETEEFYKFDRFRIAFSDTIRGIYKYPPLEKPIVPPEDILLSCPKLLEKVKELIPEWSVDGMSFAVLNNPTIGSGYSEMDKCAYACICEEAFRELEGKYVLCDKVEFNCKYSWEWATVSERSSIELDYEHGSVTSKWLDEYISRKCREVRDAISAFLTLLSDADKERMEKNRVVLMDIAKKLPVFGAIEFSGDTPCVRFSDDICIRLYIPDLEIYFEGDGFNVRTNDDLRQALHKIVPGWVDMPVSDSRILGKLRDFRESYRLLAAYQGGRRQKLPAEGAVRQFLRFKDAAKMLCDKVLHDMVGKQIACQTVELKRVDGVVSETSLAHCSEVEKMLRDAVASVQEELNVLARSRNAVLYCYGDLFPELKTHRYYEKWRAFDKAANIPQPRVGDIVNGVVSNIKEYGAFIDFSGTSGLLHISEISNVFIKDIKTFLKIGQSVEVKIIDIDAAGRIKLSMKQLRKS